VKGKGEGKERKEGMERTEVNAITSTIMRVHADLFRGESCSLFLGFASFTFMNSLY